MWLGCRAEGSEEEQQEGAEEGRLLPRVIAALQTAEGLGWEDAADEAEVQGERCAGGSGALSL